MGVFARTIGILWGLILLFAFIITSFLCFIYAATPSGQQVLIIIGGSFLAAILIFVILILIECRKPLFKAHTQLMKELQHNGYTEHFLDLAEMGRGMYKGTKSEYSFYKNFALYGAEGYLYNERYDKAMEFINSIKVEELKDETNIKVDKGAALISYYVIQMGICWAIEDKERASRVMSDAKPYMDEYRNSPDNINMLIDDFFFSYYYLNQDYTLAIEHAQNIINNKFHMDNKLIGGYLHMAYAYNKIGDQARVTENLDTATKLLAESGKALSKQAYDLTIKHMAEGK